MPVIKLTPEVLEEKASSLRDTAARNDDVIGRLDNLVNALNADWEGDAYNAFRESFLAKCETFKSFTQDMSIFADFLVKFADIMRQEEKRQTDAARQLAGH